MNCHANQSNEDDVTRFEKLSIDYLHSLQPRRSITQLRESKLNSRIASNADKSNSHDVAKVEVNHN